MTPTVAVVGGGITGLAAAWELRDAAEVTVLEAAHRTGGKISMDRVGPLTVDAGADAFLARVPWATALCEELGIGHELVSPAARDAYVYASGTLRPLPADHVLGIPLDPTALVDEGILSAEGAARAARDLEGHDALLEDDCSVGALVRRRLGDEVLDALVDPLISGISAGDTDRLSVRACAPQLATAAAADRSLIRGLRAMRVDAPSDPDAPVFHSLRPGVARLVDELRARLDDRIRVDTPVRSLSPTSGGWEVDGTAFDHVLLCLPAPDTAALIDDPTGMLGDAEQSSVALCTIVCDPQDVAHPMDGSGFLVRRDEGLMLTAASWASSKWAHLGETGEAVIRASVGRDGDERHLDLDDRALVAAVLDELGTTMGTRPVPSAVRVTRYPDSFAQYRPGHDDRVAALRAALPDRLAVAGAAFDGIGIPACIRSGRAEARALIG